MINIEQPKRARDPIRIPAREQTRRDANQVIEDRHPDREHERRRIHRKHQEHPGPPPKHSMRVQMP